MVNVGKKGRVAISAYNKEHAISKIKKLGFKVAPTGHKTIIRPTIDDKGHYLIKVKKKVCKLNSREDKVWQQKFNDYRNRGKSQSKADDLAFKDIVKQFPRLKGCDKIK